MIVWGLELKDEVSLPADAASKAMGTAAQQAKALAGAMTSAQSAMTKAQAIGDAAGVRKAAASFHQLSEALGKVPPHAEPAKTAIDEMKSKFHEGGSASDIIKKGLQAMGLSAGEAGAAMGAMGAIVGVVIGVFVAAAAALTLLVAGLYEAAKAGIEASDAHRRMTAVFEAFGAGAKGAGEKTMNMLREMSKELPESQEKLASWARTLEGAGITDLGQLKASLHAVAAAEALVEGGGDHVKNMLAKLAEQSLKGGGKVKFSLAQLTGSGIGEQEFLNALGMTPQNFAAAKKAGTLTGKQVNDAIVKALATKAEGPLAAQMGEVATVWQKGTEMISRLFEGIDTKPFVDGLKQFFSIFDDAQPSGQVMKAAITGALNTVMQVAGTVFQFLYKGFERLIIWALEAAIFVKQHKQAFEALAGVLAGAVVAAIVVVTTVVAALAVGIFLASLPILIFVAALGVMVYGIYKLVSSWGLIKAFFGNLATGAWTAAKSFVEGLVNGIENGITGAVNAVKKLGSAVVNGLKGLLGIHSPSRVMFEMGMNTSHGFAGGMEAGTDHVEGAAVGMSDAAQGAGGDGGGGVGGRSASINFGGITVNIDGSQATTPAEMQAIVEEAFAALAERLALMIGSAPLPS